MKQTPVRNTFSCLMLSKHVILHNISFLLCNGYNQSRDDQCLCYWLQEELSTCFGVFPMLYHNLCSAVGTQCKQLYDAVGDIIVTRQYEWMKFVAKHFNSCFFFSHHFYQFVVAGLDIIIQIFFLLLLSFMFVCSSYVLL